MFFKNHLKRTVMFWLPHYGVPHLQSRNGKKEAKNHSSPLPYLEQFRVSRALKIKGVAFSWISSKALDINDYKEN